MTTPFSPRSLAQRWGCSAATIRNLVNSGQLKHFKVGTKIRVPFGEVERWEASGTVSQGTERNGSVLSITKMAHADALRLRRLTASRLTPKPVVSLIRLNEQSREDS